MKLAYKPKISFLPGELFCLLLYILMNPLGKLKATIRFIGKICHMQLLQMDLAA